MKLKRLELFGFKSFADKVEFVFEPGITAIVGPNGCGKSNIVDAIKWILGEQSVKSLRGREMADIIFGGSEARPASGYAEASLTILNDKNLLPIEYEEVCVTRRLYISGESEYLLNKSICRLKDIRDLFMGTGVGINTYSIIEQGKVEALLEANAQERRLVFDEAAGVSKYKVRKREALNKLEKVEQNLLRVNDIIKEVERQLRSIKIQATKAQKYKEYSERLKNLRIALSLKNFNDLKENRDRILEEINILFNKSKDIQLIIDSLEVELKKFEDQMANIGQRISQMNSEIVELDGQATNLRDRIKFNKERLNDLGIQETRYNDELKTLRSRIEANEADRLNITKELDRVAQEIYGYSLDLESKETEYKHIALEADMLREEVEGKKSDLMNIFYSQSNIQNEIGNKATLLDTLKSRKQRIENQQSEITRQINQVQFNKQRLEDEEVEINNRLKGLAERQSDLKVSIDILEAEIETYNKEISQLEKTLSSKQVRMEVLQDYEARDEGVDIGVKAILNKVKSEGVEVGGSKEEDLRLADGDNDSINATSSFASGICGLLADIIKVELTYALAIETVLGHMTQAIVARTWLDCIQAIDFLKKTEAGNAIFLPIDLIMSSQWIDKRCSMAVGKIGMHNDQSEIVNPDTEKDICITSGTAHSSEGLNGLSMMSYHGLQSDAGQKPSGIIGMASELVSYACGFEGIINFLLDKTLVVQDFDRAVCLINNIYKDNFIGLNGKYRDIERIVTLEGDLIEPYRIIKGGVICEKTGLISRKSELKDIRNGINDIEQKIKCLEYGKKLRIDKLKEIKNTSEIVRQDMDKLNIMLLNNENEQKQDDQKLSKLDEENNINESEIREIIQSIGDVIKREQDLRQRLNGLNEQHKGLEMEIKGLSAKFEENEGHKNLIQTAITDLKVNIAKKNEKKDSLSQSLRQAGFNHKEYNERLESILEGIEECKRKRLGTVNEIDELAKNLEDGASKKQKTEDTLNILLKDQESILNRLSTIKSEIERQKIGYKGLEGQIHGLRLKENEYQIRQVDLVERISEEYNIKLSDLYEAIPDKKVEGYLKGIGAIANETVVDWAVIDHEINELRQRIERLGNVNLEAISEQDELETRYKFLTNQYDDLERSERSLKDIIEKANQTGRELFERTFNDIKENFHIYFRKLFGGGRANIVLEEGLDILEAGIDLIVQPPNKELNSIALFSGGEKVLITVALLFAILKARPTPFCVMDEVDATLDENNINRFITVLKEFAQDFQFLIVTHNKGTMRAADIIYGVTIEEPGVSKRVSIVFESLAAWENAVM